MLISRFHLCCQSEPVEPANGEVGPAFLQHVWFFCIVLFEERKTLCVSYQYHSLLMQTHCTIKDM